MTVSNKHVLSQGPVLKTLAGVALSAIRQARNGTPQQGGALPTTPGEEFTTTIKPLPPGLLKDYIRHVGGDPSAYKGVVPAHLFPQWGFPLAAKTLQGLPYPMFKVLNGGCRLEVSGQLPAGKPLRARARLEDIDDNGRRAVIHQKVVTGTDAEPDLVTGHLYAIVPLGGPKNGESKTSNGSREPKERARVPQDAEEIQRWRLRADAGLDFAKLTGDFNPVHWIPPYAKAFGFRNTILHGFSTMARAIEGVQRGLFSGSTRVIQTFDVQFTKPLVLPAKVGLYVRDHEVFVGDAPGGPAYLKGTFETPDHLFEAS
jgi:acyl dehydratase